MTANRLDVFTCEWRDSVSVTASEIDMDSAVKLEVSCVCEANPVSSNVADTRKNVDFRDDGVALGAEILFDSIYHTVKVHA